MDLTPAEARIRHGDHEEMVAVDRVAIGTTIIVRPGEKIPLDGEVRAGRSDVNQAPITGESLPIDKAPGDPVFAGTINGHGALELAVTRLRRDTTLARIIHLVETAQAQTRAVTAVHRSVCPLVHAGRDHPRGTGRGGAAVFWRRLRYMVLSGARPPCRVLSVRARHLDAGLDRVGARGRGPSRRAAQGRRAPRASGSRQGNRVRQDRDADAGNDSGDIAPSGRRREHRSAADDGSGHRSAVRTSHCRRGRERQLGSAASPSPPPPKSRPCLAWAPKDATTACSWCAATRACSKPAAS